MNEFLKEMADILDEESVRGCDRLERFNAWDSLAVLSVVAMADARYRVTLSAQQVRAAGTIDELHALMAGEAAGKAG